MAVSVFYADQSKDTCPDAASRVSFSRELCAQKVTLRNIPGALPSDPPIGTYAEITVPQEGHVTSFAMRLRDKSHTGRVLLTTVSPELDVTGAFLSVFLDDILQAAGGPEMYRRVDILSAYYCTDKRAPKKIYAIIVGGTGLDGVVADVAATVNTH